MEHQPHDPDAECEQCKVFVREAMERRKAIRDFVIAQGMPCNQGTCIALLALAAECCGPGPHEPELVQWFLGMASTFLFNEKVSTSLIRVEGHGEHGGN